MHLLNTCLAIAMVCCASANGAADQSILDKKVVEALAVIREREGVPALAAAIVTSNGVLAQGVVGVRKSGSNVAATIQDHWYLGSCTKIMTATLIGRLIDQGKLRFESTLAEVFPDLEPKLPKRICEFTVEQLLDHRTGLPWEADWALLAKHGSIADQRLATVLATANATLVASPRSSFNYSNWNYVILGAIAERIAGNSWEELISQEVFEPLSMHHMGFGGTGTRGQIDQPWPHVRGFPMFSNGPEVDFPPLVGPAATVHCPINEWGKFVIQELNGLRGSSGLLSVETFRRLYALQAMGKIERVWAGGGPAYHHSGTNNMNCVTVWIVPQRDFAVLVCTNDGIGQKACDDAAKALIDIYGSATGTPNYFSLKTD